METAEGKFFNEVRFRRLGMEVFRVGMGSSFFQWKTH